MGRKGEGGGGGRRGRVSSRGEGNIRVGKERRVFRGRLSPIRGYEEEMRRKETRAFRVGRNIGKFIIILILIIIIIMVSEGLCFLKGSKNFGRIEEYCLLRETEMEKLKKERRKGYGGN